jgi:hypothetical protein
MKLTSEIDLLADDQLDAVAGGRINLNPVRPYTGPGVPGQPNGSPYANWGLGALDFFGCLVLLGVVTA